MCDSDSDTRQSFGASALTISETNEPPLQSSSTQNMDTETNQSEMGITDGKFFQYLSEKSSADTVVALCVKCQPQVVEIKGYKSTTSNFISHLKRRHGEQTVLEYKEYMKLKRPKRISSTRQTVSGLMQMRSYDSQGAFDEDIAKFVVHSMVPLRIIEDPFFILIFDKLKISQEGLKMMSRRTLSRRINSLFESQNIQIKQELHTISFVCTTTDIWSGRKRSFLGVTAHFIQSNFQRKSIALACRRFRNTHSYDRIADLLHSIHTEFGLTQSKIVATITDNGSNFIKAFKIYGVVQERIAEEECNEYNNSDMENDSDSETYNEEEAYSSSKLQTFLPAHLRCCAHTLSLCATSDAAKILTTSKDLSIMHSQVMRKCNLLWKAAMRPKTAEIIENILGHTLSRPGETRWNSLYDSLKQILEIRPHCSKLFKSLNINNMLNEYEFKYVEEHLACAGPLAEALDLLQGENNTYYGIMLPCLVALRRKLQCLVKNNWLFCKPLSETFLNAVETRFSDFFNFTTTAAENAAIAALSYPRFKNSWLHCINSYYHESILHAFKKAIEVELELEELPQETCLVEDKFFDFGAPSTSRHSTEIKSKVELEILHFFYDRGQELDILHQYPTIKQVFLKYNTPLPSSAPVERLFSFATMTNLPKSHKLSDTMFEKRVILKANIKFT